MEFDKRTDNENNTFAICGDLETKEFGITNIRIIPNNPNAILIDLMGDDELPLWLKLEPETAKFIAEKILECLKERKEE